jgi:DNA-binding NarL/FixJ family response regulator
VVETTYVDTDRGARLLAEYESLADGGVTSQLRIAIGHLSLSAHAGGVAAAVRRARAVHSLLPAEADPLVRSSFLHSYAGALGLAGHYRDALEVADAAAQEVATNRLNFAIPHVKLKMALGAAGLRRFAHAAATLQEVQAFAAERGDVYLAANAFALEIRLLVSQGRSDEALELDWEVALGAQHPTAGEALASRAIALACVGREGAARECVALARQRSTSLEPQLLAMGADAILAVRGPRSDAASAVSAFIERVAASGAFDPLVVTYRADPRILAIAASLEPLPTVLRALVRRAKDDVIARGCGLRLPRSQKRGALSHREQDVLALIAEGLTNRSIAERLFISEATVKVHVQRIFEKLGVRSRTEAALRARAELELGGPE